MKLMITILGIMVMLSSASFAETIGFVDLQKVFVEFNETEKAKKDFEEKQSKLREEMEEKQKRLQKAEEENKSPEELQKLVMELQEELQPKQQELIDYNNQLMAKIKEKITKATKKIAKQYGVDVVVDKQALLVGGFDLTDFVIDELND